MVPTPNLTQLEREMTAILTGLTGLRREGVTLVLEGGGGRRDSLDSKYQL